MVFVFIFMIAESCAIHEHMNVQFVHIVQLCSINLNIQQLRTKKVGLSAHTMLVLTFAVVP